MVCFPIVNEGKYAFSEGTWTTDCYTNLNDKDDGTNEQYKYYFDTPKQIQVDFSSVPFDTRGRFESIWFELSSADELNLLTLFRSVWIGQLTSQCPYSFRPLT